MDVSVYLYGQFVTAAGHSPCQWCHIARACLVPSKGHLYIGWKKIFAHITLLVHQTEALVNLLTVVCRSAVHSCHW